MTVSFDAVELDNFSHRSQPEPTQQSGERGFVLSKSIGYNRCCHRNTTTILVLSAPELVAFAGAIVEPGLVDRHLAPAQPLDLLGVNVHAPYVAAELGEAGRRDQADVAGADHPDWLARGAHRGGEG